MPQLPGPGGGVGHRRSLSESTPPCEGRRNDATATGAAEAELLAMLELEEARADDASKGKPKGKAKGKASKR